MKKQTLEISLIDTGLGLEPILGQVIAALRQARSRRQIRTPLANRMVANGHRLYRRPHPESWRDLLKRYLRRILPGELYIYVGGHHLAIHQRASGTDLGPCLARFVEVRPV